MARHTAALFVLGGGIHITYSFSTSFIYCFLCDKEHRARALVSHIVEKCSRLHIHLYIDFHAYSAHRMLISVYFVNVGSNVTGAPDTSRALLLSMW